MSEPHHSIFFFFFLFFQVGAGEEVGDEDIVDDMLDEEPIVADSVLETDRARLVDMVGVVLMDTVTSAVVEPESDIETVAVDDKL